MFDASDLRPTTAQLVIRRREAVEEMEKLTTRTRGGTRHRPARLVELQGTIDSIDSLLPQMRRNERSSKAPRRHGPKIRLTDRKSARSSKRPRVWYHHWLRRSVRFEEAGRRSTYRWVANRRASDGYSNLSLAERRMLPGFADIDSEPEIGSDADETPLPVVRQRVRTRQLLRKGLEDGKAQWLKWVSSIRFYNQVCGRIRERAESHQGAQPGRMKWGILRELSCSWRCLNPECHLVSHPPDPSEAQQGRYWRCRRRYETLRVEGKGRVDGGEASGSDSADDDGGASGSDGDDADHDDGE